MRIRKGFEEKSRLGRLLINRGYLSEGQLDQALLLQRETGQRLGEALIAAGWVTDRELHRVLKHQARYRNAAALVTMVTLPFQPLVSLAPLSDSDMAGVTAQSTVGLLERIEAVAAMPGNARDGVDDPELAGLDPVEGIKLAANIFVPVLSLLDSDLTISGVHYREGEPHYSIREDGALRLAFPERIEEIRMDNIRVSGNQSPSMGNVSIHNIRFHPDSQMTIYTR